MNPSQVVLINPPLVFQRSDVFTTGIVYMPLGLAYFAATLRTQGVLCTVIDAFGEKPMQCRRQGRDDAVRGLTLSEIVARIPSDTRVVAVYASQMVVHDAIMAIFSAVRRVFPQITLVVFENTQAVTAYSLRRILDVFLNRGVDYCVTGEPEERGATLIQGLLRNAPRQELAEIEGIGTLSESGIQYRPPIHRIQDLDHLPFPAWDLIPLANYWRLKYAHGPFETSKYLPLLTSRGCPFGCAFCVLPETSGRRWFSRTPANVIDEMDHFYRHFGVTEFHLEDPNPTVDDNRIREFCRGLIRRKLPVIWKICAGTKVETIRDELTVDLMAQAGCRYVSVSPETGSQSLLKAMNKPFDLAHATRIVKAFAARRIPVQACVIIGFPGETDADRDQTLRLVKELARSGTDEIAVFVVTPVPGSGIYEQLTGFTRLAQLTFSPTWRSDYRVLNRFRLRLYRHFLLGKLRRHPLNILIQCFRFLSRRFRTKMEMTPYRALSAARLYWRAPQEDSIP